MTTTLLRDAAALRTGALERFRCVTLVMDMTAAGELQPAPARMVAWVMRYNTWFLEQVGVPQGRAQHLLYDREITLLADNLLVHADAVRMIAATARPLGFAVSISLLARDVLTQRQALRGLISQRAVTSVAVTLDDESVANAPADLVAEIENLVSAHVNVGIIGTANSFRASQALHSPLLSAADLTWYPIPTAPATAPLKSLPVLQCYSRFRLHVDARGNIYPCLGLMGLPNCSLGTIDEALADTGFGSAEVMAELDEWNQIGPDVSAPTSLDEAAGGLPLMCQWHRAALGA